MDWIKTLHISCVILSFSGFLLRGIWMMLNSVMLANKWVKIVPHIVDSLLLLSALSMVYIQSISILQHDWLLAKIAALLIYIVLGVIALKHGKTKQIRVVAWCSGLVVFLYIVSVALNKSVEGFIVWL